MRRAAVVTSHFTDNVTKSTHKTYRIVMKLFLVLLERRRERSRKSYTGQTGQIFRFFDINTWCANHALNFCAEPL